MAQGVGIRIARRRQALRMTQEELAAKLGVAKSTVANWETGKHFPKRKLGAVEEALGVSFDEEPEEPEIPPEILESINRVWAGEEYAWLRQRLIDGFRQALADTSAAPPAAGPGRHRRVG